jgi:hypothetical protein
MSDEIDRIYTKLAHLEQEITNLRQGYVVVNQRFNESLLAMKLLTVASKEAAQRSAIAAKKALLSCQTAAIAATEAADHAVDTAALSAVRAVGAAAEAAIPLCQDSCRL